MEELWLEDQFIQQRWDDFLKERPVCCLCGKSILTSCALNLASSWYCSDCVSRHTREVTEA